MRCIARCSHIFSGLGDGWFLDYVELVQLPSQRTWRFELGSWVPKAGAVLAAKVTHDVPLRPPEPTSDGALHAAAGGSDTQAQDQAVQQAVQQAVPVAVTQYEVVVSTGNKYGAGTDATISAVITGSGGTAMHTFDQVRLKGTSMWEGSWINAGAKGRDARED